MNIYEKLQTMRVALQNENISKSGKNTGVGYSYFELQDFIPLINIMMLEAKVLSVLTYTKELAILRIINSEKPEEFIDFTSPMSEATLRGTHPVQNLGAVETYIRRYLYITAFEIVDNDQLDSTHSLEAPKTPTKTITTPNNSDVPSCPRCGGEMWDNRTNKKNPKAPDFKCKNENCKDEKGYTTAMWLPKEEPIKQVDELSPMPTEEEIDIDNLPF